MKIIILQKVKNFLLIILTVTLFNSCAKIDKGSAYQLANRIIPDEADNFIFENINAEEGLDVFEIEAGKSRKIVIRGNNELAKSKGLDYYLENICNCQISLNYNQLNLPKVLPLPKEKIRIQTPFKYRYFFNYCTFGYTMPWWHWNKWEKMIDYMALKGVNMPLAITGQEAVWTEVYKEFGLSRKEIDDFFVGPAHLPWGWMGNIDGLGGPLPQGWINSHKELQKKILERERALGMTPVLPAFTGHVPKTLKAKYPTAKIMQIDPWAGIPGTYFLSPDDSLFSKIGSAFIKKQTEMYGTDHLYSADCFIEVNPPSNDPEFLAKTSATVYNSMASVDPEATWVVQGWFFFFKQNFWKKEQGEAFCNGVPKNKLIVLDLYGEKNPTWDKTDAFFGQSWIWDVICNEDQKVNMSGDMKAMQDQFNRACKSELKNNLKGIGVIPEGFGYNPIIQDFIFGKAWNQETVDLNKWVRNYASRRYNSTNNDALSAWEYFLSSVYSRTRTMWSPLITTPQLVRFSGKKEDIRHNRVKVEITKKDPFDWDFDVYELAKGAKLLLGCSDELKDVPSYNFDLVNVYRELLYALTHKFINHLSVAYDNKNIEEFDIAKKDLLKLLDDLEDLTSCNSNFMLGTWLEDAKSWGNGNQEEMNYYDRNARTIVTIWQPWENGALRDYAGKDWSGLFKDYYKPRWELFANMLGKSLKTKTPFVRKDFDKAVRHIDYQWTLKNNVYPTEPERDAVIVAKRVIKEYGKYFVKSED